MLDCRVGWVLGSMLLGCVSITSCDDTTVVVHEVSGGGDGGGQGSGYDALVRTSDEPSGAPCAAGGVRIDAGLDRNGDGELSDAEIDVTSYACNGQDGLTGEQGDHGAHGDAGESGPEGEPGPQGDSGATGPRGEPGVPGEAGINGDARFVALVTITPEPIGERCDAGGQRIDVGLDDGEGDGEPADGLLHEDEIDDTQYVCNGLGGPEIPAVIEGNYTIENGMDIALLQGVTEITGDVTFFRTALTTVSLPDLVTIGGHLVLEKNYTLTTVNLPALETIGGHAIINEEPNGALSLLDNETLASIDMHSLRSIEGALRIDGNAFTTTAWLDALETVGGIVRARGAKLTAISFPALTSVAGLGGFGSSGEIQDDVLVTISLPELTSTSSTLYISQVDSLETLSLPALLNTGGYGRLIIDDNDALETVTLTALTTVADELTISNNALLSNLDLGSFDTITGANTTLTLTQNAVLPQCIVDVIASQVSPAPTTSNTCCNQVSCPL
jgi:hypothetical protein